MSRRIIAGGYKKLFFGGEGGFFSICRISYAHFLFSSFLSPSLLISKYNWTPFTD